MNKINLSAGSPVPHFPDSVEAPNKVAETIPAPLVSVVVPTYNHASFIAECLDSVIMQKTTFPFEIIVGEDFSTDRTREIVFDYAAKHPGKIRLITAGHNTGQTINWMRCLKSCRGIYTALCDGDDYWTDELKLEKQAAFMQANPGYSMCYHSFRRNISGKLSEMSPSHPKDFRADDLIATPAGITGCSKFVRNVFADTDTETLALVCHDYPMNAYLGTFGHCKYLESVGPSVYRMHEGGAYSSKDQQSKIHIVINIKMRVYQYFLARKDQRRTNLALNALKEYLDANPHEGRTGRRFFDVNSSGITLAFRGMKFEWVYRPVTNRLKALMHRVFRQGSG